MAVGRIKGITIEIGGDTTKLVKALASVDSAISKTEANLRDINKALKLDPTNTDLIKDKQLELAKQIESTEEKVKKEQQALEELNRKLDEPFDVDHAEEFQKNAKAAEDLKIQIDLDKSALKQLKDEARDFGSVLGVQMQAAGEKVKEVGSKIKEVGDKVSAFGQELTTKVTVPIVAGFATSAKSAIDWESAFTGVMKTVDETATTTYEDLKDDINEIAKTTASSQNEIAGVMEIAGQLGVSADNIAEFTKVMVMLGDTTNLSSEEAAASIAKFSNVTNMSLSDVDKLGAVIVDLGNNYATTEADIMSMATRLSGAGAQIGLTQGEILGLATAMSSVGIEAEMGGSAMSKAMVKMQVAVETGFDQVNALTKEAGMSLREIELMSTNDTKGFKELASSLGMTTTEIKEVIKNGNNLTNFAEVAGTTTEEFVKMYRDDAPAALQAFISGLGDTEGHGESTIAMLQEMGFTEVRLRDTLTRLANSQGLVTEAMSQGNQAWGENEALSAEAEKRYATMAAQIQQAKNSLTELAVEIGEMLMPYIQKGIEYIGMLVDKWKSLDDSQKEMIIKIAAIVAAVGPAILIVGQIIGAIGTIVSAIGGFISIIGTVISFVTSAIGVIQAVGAAFVALTGPVGIVIAIIAAVVAAVIYLWNNCEWFRDGVIKIWESIKEAFVKAGENIKLALENAKNNITNIWNAIKTDWIRIIDNIKSGIANKFNEIKTDVTNKATYIKTSAINIFNQLMSGIASKMSSIKDSIVNGFQNAIDFITSLPSRAWGWGSDIIHGIADGIRSAIGVIADAASSIAETIWDFLHFSEPEEGPLKNFHTFMPDMAKEMVNGINRSIPMLENAMNGMASVLVPSMAGGAGTSNNMTANNTFNITVNGAGKDIRAIANELTDIIQDNINAQVYNQEAVFA